MIEAYRTVRAALVARRDKIDQTIALLDAAIADLGDAPEPAKPKAPKARARKNGSAGEPDFSAPTMVLDALKEAGPEGITSAKLRDELGWPVGKFKMVVGALVTDGKVVKFGELAGTGYRLP